LKYERVTALSSAAAQMTRNCIEAAGILDEVDLIVPVPIHWRRRAWRGFNQSEILCEALPKEKVHHDAMYRTRYTRPQVGLPLNQRLVNLANSFDAERSLEGARVLLVDDVYTSGATARECAKTLKARGASLVGMFALTSSNIS
jgi:ComF family protein